MPVAVNPFWLRPIECLSLRGSFESNCGSKWARPTCVCANGDTWLHPYWQGSCAGGGNPDVCTCPNGANFPVTG